MLSITKKQEDHESSLQSVFLSSLEKIECGGIQVTLPSGQLRLIEGRKPGPMAEIEIHSKVFYEKLFSCGDIGLGEAFIANLWNSDDLATLIEFAVLNKTALQSAIFGQWRSLIIYKLKHFFNSNSKSGSKRNIHAHYDLGNSFYSQWLDSTMTYSSAYWGNSSELSLAQAQSKKYQLILDQLNAKPGDHILEIGCGWGGFAQFAAEKGYRVTGITISEEQFSFAQKRIVDSKLSDLVTLQLIDYRDLEGRYDHVVSIEMIEAVGEKYWDTFFKKIKTVVKPQGRVAIQSIVIDDAEFDRYRTGTDFIQQYIFPGGLLPSLQKLKGLAASICGSQPSWKSFGLDYARTLSQWAAAFNTKCEQLPSSQFDESFKRTWSFYLAYCEGSFRARYIDVVVLSFQL